MNANVLICTPTCGGTVHLDYLRSLMAMEKHNATAGIKSQCIWTQHTITSAARNVGVNALLKDDQYTHLMFLDSDQTWPAATLERLLSHNVDVVGGLYRTRKASGCYMAFEYDAKCGFYHHISNIKMGRGLLLVDAMPTGVMLIKRHVIEQTPKPIFYYNDKIHLNEQWVTDMTANVQDFKIDPDRLQYGYGHEKTCLVVKK